MIAILANLEIERDYRSGSLILLAFLSGRVTAFQLRYVNHANVVFWLWRKPVVGLNEFCKQCQDTYQTMVLFPGTVSTQSNHTVYAQSESLKRPKESSSSIGVSPDTARCRPPSKRPSGLLEVCFFPGDSCELVHACSIKCLHFDANFILSSSTMYAD